MSSLNWARPQALIIAVGRIWDTPSAALPILALHRVRRGLLPDEPAGELDGLDDLLVARAAAEVVRQGLLDRLHIGIGIRVQQGLGGHDHPGRTEAALDGAGQDKGLLDEVRILGRPEPLDADDLGPLQLHHLGEAGTDRLAVDDDHAGAALPLPVAGLLRPGQAQVLAQVVEQDHVRTGLHLLLYAVYCQSYFLHFTPFLRASFSNQVSVLLYHAIIDRMLH